MSGKLASGCVFHQRYKSKVTGELKETATWYIRYYVNGKPVTLAADTENYDEAVEFLRKKMADSTASTVIPERVKMGQLFDLVIEDYRQKGRHSLDRIEGMVRVADKRYDQPGPLRAWFGSIKARDVTRSLLRKYIAERLRDKPKPANATINRELACVRRALTLGKEEDPPLVLHIPKFDMLENADPREGTLPHEIYKAVRDTLPNYARLGLVIGYHTGARKGEITKILRELVDFKAARILMRRSTAKNKKPRYIPIYGDMAAELDMAIAAGDPKCQYLLQNKGQRVYDFEKAWATACELAGVPGSLFHDLRRTALTNMIEAGFSEKEAMEISGHKTRNVFDRYHIVSERRLKELTVKLGDHMKAKDQAAPVEKGLVQ
jgi:integrase